MNILKAVGRRGGKVRHRASSPGTDFRVRKPKWWTHLASPAAQKAAVLLFALVLILAKLDFPDGALAVGAVAHRASIAASTANPTTTFNITIPAGVQAGDDCYVAATSRDHLVTDALVTCTDNDSGGNTWTLKTNSTDRKAYLWWKKATSATASKTITVATSIGSASGGFTSFSGALASGDPTTNLSLEDNASGNEAHAQFTVANASSMIVVSIHNTANDNAVTVPSFAQSPNFLTTAFEKLSTGGSDCATFCGYDLHDNGTWFDNENTGTFSWSQTNGTTKSIVWAVQPDTGGGSVTVTPPTLAVSITELAPTVPRHITVPAKSVTITELAPTIPKTVIVPLRTVSLATFAPTVTAGGSVSVTPPAAAVAITTFVPVVTADGSVVLTPPARAVSTQGFAPVVPKVVNVPVRNVALQTLAPVLPKRIEIPRLDVVLSTFAPDVEAVGDVEITPPPAVVTITTFAPAVVTTGGALVTPGPVTVTLTTFPPTVTAIGDQPPPSRGAWNPNWRRIVEEFLKKKDPPKKAPKERVVLGMGRAVLSQIVGYAEGDVSHIRDASGMAHLFIPARAIAAGVLEMSGQGSAKVQGVHAAAAAGTQVLVDKDTARGDELLAMALRDDGPGLF